MAPGCISFPFTPANSRELVGAQNMLIDITALGVRGDLERPAGGADSWSVIAFEWDPRNAVVTQRNAAKFGVRPETFADLSLRACSPEDRASFRLTCTASDRRIAICTRAPGRSRGVARGDG
jgi:hypothetical protein